MVRKENGLREAFMRNIFPNKDKEKNVRGKNVERSRPAIIKSKEVVFDRSSVEKSREVKKRAPEEEYVYLSSLGTILDRVDKKDRLSRIRSEMKKAGKEGIETFLKAGVLELSSEDKDIAVTHREKLKDYFKDTEAALVLHEYMKNPGMAIENIAKGLPLLKSTIIRERLRLLRAGFLEKKRPEGREIIVLTKYSEGFGIENWGLEAKIEELKRKKAGGRDLK